MQDSIAVARYDGMDAMKINFDSINTAAVNMPAYDDIDFQGSEVIIIKYIIS